MITKYVNINKLLFENVVIVTVEVGVVAVVVVTFSVPFKIQTIHKYNIL